MTIRHEFAVALTAYLLGVSLAFAQPEVEIEFITSFGGFGKTEPGTFDWPVAIAIDDQGRILIADNDNHRIQRCTLQGDCEAFGNRGSQLGEFVWPLGIDMDSLGRIIVSEAGNDRIQLLDSDGSWSSFGSTGQGGPPGEFRLPAGIVVDGQDRIIIADEKNHRIQICDDTGSCSAFGSRGSSPGSFDTPRAVGLTSQGKILVADFGNHRIQICSYEGECTAFGEFGAAPGQIAHPSGVTADSQDRILLSDRDNYRFQICDSSGACAIFGEFGSGPGQFQQLEAIAVDDQNRIYVADVVNQDIQIFQATYADGPPPPDSFQINAGLNDAWFNPATNGQGFLISVFPDIRQVFLAWFTYDTERPPEDVTAFLGEPGHRWLTAQGPYDGDTATLTIYVTEGGVFDAAEPVAETDLAGDGTITLEFADCSAGLVNYEITSLGISGEIPIQRIVEDNVPLCEALVDQLQKNQ
jgi:hypothetical protein